MRQGETESSIHWLIPQNFNGWGQARTKPNPGTRASSSSPTWVAGAQTLGTSSTAFLRSLAGSWNRSSVTGTQLVPIWNAGTVGKSFTSHSTKPAPYPTSLTVLSLGNTFTTDSSFPFMV